MFRRIDWWSIDRYIDFYLLSHTVCIRACDATVTVLPVAHYFYILWSPAPFLNFMPYFFRKSKFGMSAHGYIVSAANFHAPKKKKKKEHRRKSWFENCRYPSSARTGLTLPWGARRTAIFRSDHPSSRRASKTINQSVTDLDHASSKSYTRCTGEQWKEW